MAQTFNPPKSAQNNARRVLDWKKEHGDEVRGMTSVGWARARQLASGSLVSLETVKRMAQFARHRSNAAVDPKYKNEPWKDRGYVAWLGWGGTTGIEWAKSVSERETTKQRHDYATTQIDLPPEIVERVQFFQRIFRPEDLAEDGLETEPHITLLYGLSPSVTPEQVAEIAGQLGPFDVTFPKVSLFENDGFDVVKIDVESDRLRELRARLEDLPNENTWRIYNPHVTLAYVKPGEGRKYLMNPLEKAVARVTAVTFSDADENKTLIPLMARTEKALSDIPNYRRVGDASLQKCATCKLMDKQSYCTHYKAKVNPQYTCDVWRPQTEKAAGAAPTGAMGHGPGGLFSMPGLSLDQERRLKALRRHGWKPSRQQQSSERPRKRQAERPRKRQARRGQQSSHKAICPLCGREVADTPVTLATGRKVTTCKSCANRLGVAMKPGMPGGPHGPSIKNPRVYEALRKRGYSKERAAAISNSMRMKELVTGSTDWQRNGSFAVFKDKAGEYRWVAISSNAYRDRDGEIVSQKALEADVERADKTGDYGPIRFWHVPTTNLGKCDFNMMHGRHLIESGTFTSKEIGQAIAKAAPNLQLSIGFRHPKDEPDRDGVFHNIRRFERSLVLAGRAANPFTSLSVKESNMSTEAEKLKALKALLNDDALMNSVLGQAETNEKQADGMGIAFKSSDDLSKMTPDQLLDYALNLKEAEVEAAEKAETAKPEDKKEDMAEEEDGPMKELKGYVTKMGGYMDRMEKMFGETKKEVSQQGEQVEAHTMRFESLESTIKELTGKLEEATKELATLKSEQPKAIANGYRPTQSAETVTKETPVVEATKEGSDAWGSFLDFAGMTEKAQGVQPG